ncbi:MAG: prepilin-type N-terminal cleavage/methylation domain-containing protein [Candidatus Omnitrophota bacterium]
MNKYKNNKGFSLIEVLVASVIFTIAAVGLFATVSSLRGGSDKAERRLEVTNIGRQLLEELRSKIGQAAWPLTCDGNPQPWPNTLLPAAGTNPTYDRLSANPFNLQFQYICDDVDTNGDAARVLYKVDQTITYDEP